MKCGQRGGGGVLWLMGLLSVLVPGAAQAAIASCAVSSSTTNFGAYNPLGASPLDGVGNVRVSCSLLGLPVALLVSYSIALSTGASGSFVQRQMSNGTHVLNYNLYPSSAFSTVWGDGTGGTPTLGDSYLLLLATARDYPVYGRISAGQNVSAGAYADTVVVTVNY